jgi:quercetin dioxygenase-like cupin family protein
MTSKGFRVAALAAAVALAVSLSLVAQQPPAVKRTVASRTDLLAVPDREAVMVWVDLPAGAAEGRHTHNAEVFAFVLEGTVTLETEGSPKVTLKAGDTFRYVPGTWHEAVNVGTTPARFAAVFVAEKGKPLTTPVK